MNTSELNDNSERFLGFTTTVYADKTIIYELMGFYGWNHVPSCGECWTKDLQNGRAGCVKLEEGIYRLSMPNVEIESPNINLITTLADMSAVDMGGWE